MPREVVIKNTNAIEHLRIPIPAEGEGGVVVLRGTNGVGKSTAIRAVEAAATGRDVSDFEPRDGAASGSIDGLGITIRVGHSRNSRTGEFVCLGLDGKLSLEDLVDPGIVDPEKADNKRIKTLVRLSKCAADPQMFAKLFNTPEEFSELVRIEEIGNTDDILVMAESFKKLVEKKAREFEGKVNTEAALAASCLASTQNIDLDAESDPAVLKDRFEKAVRRDQQVKAEAKAAYDQNKRIEDARTALEMISGSDAGKTALEAKAQLDDANKNVADLAEIEKNLVEQLDLVRRNLKAAQESQASASRNYLSAKRALDLVEQYQRTLAEAGEAAVPPSKEFMDAAAEEVAAANAAVEQGTIIRQAKAKLQEREQHLTLAQEYSSRAASLRNIVAGIDGVLSEQIAALGGRLRVEKDRLVVTTDRGTELFSDLSDGERWKEAINAASEALGPDGVLTAGQAAWEGFSDSFKDEISEHLKRRKVTLVTAQVTNDSQLTAEIYK